jgi:hypothetical protein
MTMPMRGRVRKLALTAHVTSSVGWLGAVVAYLAVALVGLTAAAVQDASAAYIAMWMIASSVIVPFSVAALVTGLVQSLGTEWGLFRHYWIATKFVLTVAATIVLWLHVSTVRRMAELAASPVAVSDAGAVRIQLVVHAAGGLVVLLTATVLSVFKPWGKTPLATRAEARGDSRATWRTYVVAGVVVAFVLVVAAHVVGGGALRH